MISVVGCFVLSEIRISFNALSTSFTSFICLDFFHFFAQFYCPSGCITLTVDGYKRRISRFASCLLTATCIFTRRDNGCPVHLRRFCLNGRSRQVEKKLAPFSRHCQAKLFGENFQFYYCSKTIDPPRNLSPFFHKERKKRKIIRRI